MMVESQGVEAGTSGVVVRNSKFGGNSTNADAVRCDVTNGMTIDNNDFSSQDDVDPYHTDPIQIYGGKRCIIRRNFFHDMQGVAAYIMQADGGDHNIIEDNVFRGGPGVIYGITLYSDNGSIIRHNTFERGVGGFSVPSGTLNLGYKAGQAAGSGSIIENNTIAAVRTAGSAFTARNNLTQSTVPGTGNIVGTPVFIGPLNTYAGYRLAAGSPGKGAATDGTDIGIR
jgi:Right handed beta helix region